MGRILLRSVRRDARVSGSRASRGTGYNEMMTIKRTAVIIFMIFFIFISAFDCRYFSYASSNWEDVTPNEELVEAFQYYCKSRDLTIEGSLADAVTSFTTQTFNNICNALGYDITALQAHLKKETDGSNIRYLFDSTGITAYNAIFSQFLQDNEIDVGDSVNKTLYSGKYNTGGLFVYEGYFSQTPVVIGTDIIDMNTMLSWELGYSDSFALNINGFVFTFSTTTYRQYNRLHTHLQIIYNSNIVVEYDMRDGTNTGNFKVPVLFYNLSDNRLYIAARSYNNTIINSWNYLIPDQSDDDDINVFNVNINLTSNNINNNNYEGDTIINNYGTPSDPNAPDEPTNPLPPDNPYDDPDPDSSDPPSDWDIDLPDLDINWILTGKEKKSPWDIPFL